MRRLAWGVAAAGAYVVVAMLTPGPVAPLLDGLAPPTPYRWVEPPEGFDPSAEEALAGEATQPVEENSAVGVITADGQAQMTALVADLDVETGTEMTLEVEPLAPQSLGPPPPGFSFDSNAYSFEMTSADGRPVGITGEATVLLRYASQAGRMARWDGSRWELLETTVLRGTMQLWGNVTELGTFVALWRGRHGGDEGGLGWPVWAGIGAGAVAVLAGIELFLRRRRKRGPSAKKERKKDR